MDHRHRLAELRSGNAAPVHYGYDSESRLSTVSNDAFSASYAYTDDAWDAGYTITQTNGIVLSRTVIRDPYRRSLVKAITNSASGVPYNPLAYTYDLLNRVTSRNADTFDYNARSEVTAAIIQPAHTNRYAFDNIGNALWTSLNAVTNIYTANELNQYFLISNHVNHVNPVQISPVYDLDGNMTWDGRFSYTYDAENRLVAAYSNGLCVVSNAYDHLSRRVLKVTPNATYTCIYDGWNLVQETISTASGTTTNHYVWGKDLSGTLQGAGGVGGLLAVSLNGAWYFPFYDNNGNIIAYADETGTIVAEYTYDAFGRTIAATGSLADAFRHRFSTKYYDAEIGLYYYGYRFCAPELMRWLNQDPIGEEGGVNLYAFCGNDGVNGVDLLGMEPEFGIMAGLILAPSTRGGVEMSFNLIGSARWDACDWATFSADIGVSVLRGGMIGAPRGANGKSYNIFANVSGTVGYGDSEGLPFAFNGSQWVSALDDTYSSSASFGQTWYYNEALGESVRMANLRLQGGGAVFLNYNNDIWNPSRLGFGDGGDRGWTGGAMLGFALGGGQTLSLAFDDFTGKATNLKSFEPQNPNEQTDSSRALNQAQWTILATGLDGMSLGFSFDSPDMLNAQHWIHSTISKEAGYFSYPQSFDLRIKMQGSFGGKRR
ncbi:MAG: RHS repeat-associated core domain-containing protein [Kiritimatiellia bacterium]